MMEEQKYKEQKYKLRRALSLWEVVALAVGGMVCTWIVEIIYWYELSGAGAFWALLASGLLVLPLALIYSELSGMLPFAGGEVVWTTNAFGPTVGWALGWLLSLLYLFVLPIVSYDLATIGYYAWPNVPFSTIKLIAAGIVGVWLIITMFKVELSGKFALGTAIGVVAVVIIQAGAYLASGQWHYSNLTPWFPKGLAGFGSALGILLFKYVGFDVIPQYSQEAKYPLKDQWKAYLGVIFITFFIYGSAIILNGGVWGTEKILNAKIVDPVVADSIGMHWLAILIIIAAILVGVNTMPGFWGGAARALYGLSTQRQLPPILSRVNRYGQPWVANIVVGVLGIYFVGFAPERWIEYIYTVFSFTAGVVYFIVSLSFIKLRIAHPEWPRPYKAPAWKILGAISIAYTLWVIYASLSDIQKEGVLALIGYYILGLAIYAYMAYKRKKDPENYGYRVLTPADIPKETLMRQ